MLLRIVPLAAIIITLIAFILSAAWRPYERDGLHGSAHRYSALH